MKPFIYAFVAAFVVVALLLVWLRRFGKKKPEQPVSSAQAPIRLTREELEQLLFKGGIGSGSAAAIKFLVYAGALMAVLVLLLISLPQSTIDGLAQRLAAVSQSTRQSSLVNPEKLDLLTLDEQWNGSSLTISGTVRNATNDWLPGIQVVIKLYGKSGPLVNTLFADLDERVLQPGKQAGFRVVYQYLDAREPLAHYEISFKLRDGTALMHKDARGAGR